VLHTYLRNTRIVSNNVDVSVEEMPQNQLLPLNQNNSRSASSTFLVRQKFTDYFTAVGSVPWQADNILRGKY
jgi:hypothetical protein